MTSRLKPAAWHTVSRLSERDCEAGFRHCRRVPPRATWLSTQAQSPSVNSAKTEVSRVESPRLVGSPNSFDVSPKRETSFSVTPFPTRALGVGATFRDKPRSPATARRVSCSAGLPPSKPFWSAPATPVPTPDHKVRLSLPQSKPQFGKARPPEELRRTGCAPTPSPLLFRQAYLFSKRFSSPAPVPVAFSSS